MRSCELFLGDSFTFQTLTSTFRRLSSFFRTLSEIYRMCSFKATAKELPEERKRRKYRQILGSSFLPPFNEEKDKRSLRLRRKFSLMRLCSVRAPLAVSDGKVVEALLVFKTVFYPALPSPYSFTWPTYSSTSYSLASFHLRKPRLSQVTLT